MENNLIQKTKTAINQEKKLVECFEDMLVQSENPRAKAIIHDLILMEEMNEVLLRSLNQHLGK